MHRFETHPLKYKRAFYHFGEEKPKKKCHEVDVAGEYTDEEIVRRFGYRGK